MRLHAIPHAQLDERRAGIEAGGHGVRIGAGQTDDVAVDRGCQQRLRTPFSGKLNLDSLTRFGDPGIDQWDPGNNIVSHLEVAVIHLDSRLSLANKEGGLAGPMP